MVYNKVGKDATNKYRAKYEFIQIRVQQGEREIIAKHAESQGESINSFINRAVKETIANDERRINSENKREDGESYSE